MTTDKFKVFISWSGPLAMRVASVWRDLVKDIFDVVEPFMSEENIGAGTRGLQKVADELSGTSFGIIVVTQDNQGSQWLNYEAGALSKDLGDETTRVAPSLVDFDRKGDITGPLGQFQASFLNEEGIKFILLEIAKLVNADEGSVTKRFNNAWREEYEARFSEAKSADASQPSAARRDQGEMLDEILNMVRDIARAANTRIDLNTPAMVREFGSSYGTLSREYVSGMVQAVLQEVPDTGGGVSSTQLSHRSDGKPAVVVQTSFDVPSPFRERIIQALSRMNVFDVNFEKLNIQHG